MDDSNGALTTTEVSTADRTGEECARLLVDHLALIDRLAASSARRHRLGAEDMEDFGAVVRLKLVEDDYAVFRKFRGRSSLKTYLAVVVQRMLLDYCRSRRGRWRPSGAARKEGPVAVLFEQLTDRDGLSFSEACSTLEARQPQVTPEAVEQIESRTARRPRVRFVGLEALAYIPAHETHHDESVLCGEFRTAAARSQGALAAAIRQLDPGDRALLKLRFDEGLSVADISRTLVTNQRALYRKIDRLLATVRGRLECAGVSAEDVRGRLC